MLLELTLLASVTHKKNPYLVNVAFAVGRLFTKLCPVKLTFKAFKMVTLNSSCLILLATSLKSDSKSHQILEKPSSISIMYNQQIIQGRFFENFPLQLITLDYSLPTN